MYAGNIQMKPIDISLRKMDFDIFTVELGISVNCFAKEIPVTPSYPRYLLL